ncbi:protein transport protein Sec16A isoform X3 [Hemicordylus capensis]|uniref:protein transport protein Sec16A isoform X3 n=1 Tax=Hemicordylus capensis TaxID=884348 RepID=UPI002302EAAF|nr:protein transport protein Sec16A isoform X3 [Hemicordylus capensis]
MQPPPQAVPPRAGGPPPLATARNAYWRNGPFGRRGNTQVSSAAGPVPPVTDPFAFGRQALPQGSLLGNAPKGNPPAMPGFPPMTFAPAAAAPPPHAGDNPHGLPPPWPAPLSQPGASGTPLTMGGPLPALPAHITNSSAQGHPRVERGGASPPGPAHSLGGAALEQSAGGYAGLAWVPGRPLSPQEVGRSSSHPSAAGPASAPLFPPAQQTVPQWKPLQGSGQPPGPAPAPYADPSPPLAFYSAPPQSGADTSRLGPHPSPPLQPPAVPNATQAPRMFEEAPSMAGPHSSAQNSAWQSAGVASPWQGQFPQEHFYLQPLETTRTLSHAPTQESRPSAQPPGVSEAASGPGPAEADSGTISMFFKGDEAENEEILSLEKTDPAGQAEPGAFQQTMGHTYYQPLHPQQLPAAALSQAQANPVSTAETLQRGADALHPPRTAYGQRDLQATPRPACFPEDKAGLPEARGQYENNENLEYVQNQEVLPSELPAHSRSPPSVPSDPYRYASLLAPLPPKNSPTNHLEGGPNLEAPDSLPQPVRPDSVSSSYSNLSHRSVSGSARPQEPGTFIQQESGKPEEEASAGFFMQIDSSPLSLAGEPNPAYPRGLSPRPTPSPPKPTGVFQPSANSSFEPVRSHGPGVRGVEVDQAKMVVELRGSRPNQRSSKKSPAAPAAFPGNLEQPPDNLETLFPPQAQPLPLTLAGDAASVLVPPSVGGPLGENAQPAPEKRPSARAQGATKKCESPATTLWAQNELPHFGGNVLLAPAAPAVYVPAKPVVQPPDEGAPSQSLGKPGALPHPPPPPAGTAASSENQENPPKMGAEEALRPQASSGYASLLSSPPTEALQNPPVLIAQPHQSAALPQPVNFSLANQQRHKSGSSPLAKDPAVSHPPFVSTHRSASPLAGNLRAAQQPGSLGHPPASAQTNPWDSFPSPLGASEATPPSAGLLAQPASQGPLNLAAESRKAPPWEGLPLELASKPGSNAPGSPGTREPPQSPPHQPHSQEPPRVLDTKTPEQSGVGSGAQGPDPPLPSHASLGEPPPRGQQHFYPQVTKDTHPPVGAPSQRALQQQQTASSLPSGLPPQGPLAPPSHQAPPGLAPDHRPGPAGPLGGASSAEPPASQPGPSPAPTGQPSASTSAGAGHPAGPPSQPELQQPHPAQNAFGPPPHPYYYYYHRPPPDAYAVPYPAPYPPVDPRTAQLYYQEDAYGRYDYQPYNSSAAYTGPADYHYMEPERPSSRASHASDRPPSRQGYPEDYYSAKSGWNDYYAGYYANPYEYGDPNRLDRYPSAYDARFRDPRTYDQRYWCDADQRLYQKREAYGNSQDRYDPWQYDPRFAGSFDDDLEPRRDPYGEDFDRRSVHSEHSGHSLRSSHSVHSRQSSFSSRSQQSQLYRSSHDLTAGAYEVVPQPASLHTEYSYGGYDHLDSQPPFTDYSYSAHTAWPAAEQVPSRPLTPEKFSVPHVCARFGPGGYLIKVLPNVPSDGQPALAEIHSMEMVMQHSSEQEEMRAFPGPLTKDDTHKVDVINFAQKKATKCSQDDSLIDKASARLLWDFVVLLCRQNGTVVGTDLAELLLRDHKTVWLPGKSPHEANLIDFTNEALERVEEESGEAQLSFLTDSLLATIDGLEKETERFRELLLYGRKKDALESAMKHGLWGHALLLASKMDSRTHARVMTRFANSLPINDPLQTVYQLMSGRMPAASTCCGDERWGDWRPHLAMVLSNLTNNMDVESRTITTMGDTLASKGLLDAAHFCYLMAQVGFGVYTKKTTKLVLLGSNHSLPFLKFATNEAIRRTEAYEYAHSLGPQPCCLPNFQVFKFIYACRLAEVGLAAQAFHYCEVISKAILRSPCYYSPVLVSQLIQTSARLRLFDPQMKEKPEQELFIEPDWLVRLRHLDGQIKEGSIAYSAGRSTPQQYACSTPSSELDQASPHEGLGAGPEASSGPENPLLASLLPSMGHPLQSVQLMPSAPQAMLDSSSSQHEPWGPAPFGSMAGPGPGFPNAQPAEQGLPPSLRAQGGPLAGSPAQAQELPLQEQISQEAAVQGVSRDSPLWKAAPEPRKEDFYEQMANMGAGWRSRSASQSSAHMGFGRRSRTTSESSVHSVGRERRNSATKPQQQPSPPPPAIPEGQESKKQATKQPAYQKGGSTWFQWLWKSKNEAHLPDDKNKSIVWDEKKQRWVNLDEPEEESKPPPPPPMGFPQAPQAAPSGAGSPPGASVNSFYRKAAGSRARYVDFLNPGGAKVPAAGPPLAPADLFAPLAPMPIPASLLAPSSVPEEQQQPMEGQTAEEQMTPGSQSTPEVAAGPPYLNSASFPPGSELPPSNPDGSPSGELSRSSSLSSLSREVSQHFKQPPLGGPPAGTVQFYNPSQFSQDISQAFKVQNFPIYLKA